jgi:hypothetical protein
MISAQDLMAGLVDELPAPAPVEPFAFLEDDVLPPALAPVEPMAYALACAQAAWGVCGPRN